MYKHQYSIIQAEAKQAKSVIQEQLKEMLIYKKDLMVREFEFKGRELSAA